MSEEFKKNLGDDLSKTRLGYYISEIYKIERDYFNKELAKINITFSQLQILNWLWRKGEMSQKEIHELVNIKPSSLSSGIKILIKKDLVIKLEDKKDARIRKIRLTEKAKSIEKKAWDIVSKFNQKMSDILGFEEYNETIERLEYLIKELDK